ncbi:probable leucine-rich repeat receptor-like protein kinase At1g35710 [Neltuma alba]|uniref:probable leucine-rich repeat receptor-like protein kinase At1g35710 n=1 Tax=Neltuma alba TaxID=207710 RepID=UPI0010A50719|nr:probable leucine-rich repeat receptor-like protein kinase At1g35710 [Prosopis alba]
MGVMRAVFLLCFVVITCFHINGVASVAMIKEEKHALLQTKCWNFSNRAHNLSDPCHWEGISCNDFGSLVEMNYQQMTTQCYCLADFNFTAFPNLECLTLSKTGLIDTIPSQIGSLHKLIHLNLSFNNLTGIIPSQIGALQKLTYLDLFDNSLTRIIPSQIGYLQNLTYLGLSYNSLTGIIPSQIAALQNLTYLDISSNSLTGSIPSQIGSLHNLIELRLYSNSLTGTIPSQIGSLHNLIELDLSYNCLTDPIPTQIEDLPQLTYLNLSYNNIVSRNEHAVLQSKWWNLSNGGSHYYCDWDGISCDGLGRVILINQPRIYSQHPQLADLNFTELERLKYLNLSRMGITGTIPTHIGGLQNLNYLDLSCNNLTGIIPTHIGGLQNLNYLDLSCNNLSGGIPSSIFDLRYLQDFDASQNQLSGGIPEKLGNFNIGFHINVSQNNLSGNIPDILNYLDVDVNFTHNKFNGILPSNICSEPPSCSIDLSYNSISGSIPGEFGRLQYINLSYNLLSGYVPSEVYSSFPHDILNGNRELLTPEKIHKGSKSWLKIIIPLTIFLVITFVVGFILFESFKKHKKSISKAREAKNGDLFSIWNYDGKIAYEDIIEATEDFDIKYCIGTGAYGSVYRAQLPSGKIIALKKLHRREYGDTFLAKSFHNEVKMLSEIRHRNIVKLHGFCLHNQCMFLIYEYMERGSLFYVLNYDDKAKELNWSKRVNAIKEITNALLYIHHHCAPSIIH